MSASPRVAAVPAIVLVVLVGSAPAFLATPARLLAAPAAASPEAGAKKRLSGAPPEGPLVRIGLTTDRRKVTIDATRAYRIRTESGANAWRDSYTEPILVTTHGAKPTNARVWRVQVASLESRTEADKLAASLKARTGEPVEVSWNPDRGSWRVRVGGASSRGGIVPSLQKIRALGYPDAWAADEPAQGGDAWIRLVDDEYDTAALDVKRVIVTAERGGRLSVGKKSYRGTIEIRVDESAGLRVINELPLEDYLLGVVPAELGPAAWPSTEALKAQSVAARTYVVRNLGRFSEEGFDICDTPRCQVYEGRSVEHTRSDRAVLQTAGIVAMHDGAPINALYTSTCGGHTEDGGEIFPEEASPYLRGVPCYPEEETLRDRGVVIEGTAASDAGAPFSEVEAAALLLAAGITGPETFTSAWREAPLASREARELIERAGRRLGLEGRVGEGRNPASRLGFSLALADRLGWSGRADFLVESRDLLALLPFVDREAIPAADRPAVAALYSRGLLPDAPAGRLSPEGPIRAGEALVLLRRAAETYDEPDVGKGTVLDSSARTLRLRGRGGVLELAPPGRLALFLDSGGGPVPHQRLAVYPGDRIRWARAAGGEVTSLTILPERKGLSDDRYSPVYSWQVTLDAAELRKRISQRFDIGSLLDIQPARRGVSGRVVELKVGGTRGETLLTGFNVRTALGLKESLFAVERQKGADGVIRKAHFSGKGWGHGVGLCQVGAYGMGVRGSDFRKILTHYYTDIDLVRMY